MIPKDTVAAARAALQLFYDDRADVYRVALSGNVVEQKRAYTALPCHLSLDSKPVLQQGEQVATARRNLPFTSHRMQTSARATGSQSPTVAV